MSKHSKILVENNVQLHTLGKAVRDSFMNTICLVFVCPKHSKVLLRQYYEVDSLWFPFVWSQTGLKPKEIVANCLESLKTCPFLIDSMLDIHYLRTEISTGKFVIRKTTLVNIIEYQGECCSDFSDLKWYPIETLLNTDCFKLEEDLFGGLENLLKIVCQDCPKSVEELRYKSLEYYKSKPPEPDGQWLTPSCLTAFDMTEHEWSTVYAEFMQFTFPVFHMTVSSFELFMMPYMLGEMETILYKRLFNAFDHSRCGYLSFIDFISGLIQLEWGCLNDALRAQFVFRFYDLNRKDTIDDEHLAALTKDLNFPDCEFSDSVSPNEFEELFASREDFKLLVKFKHSFLTAIVCTHSSRKDNTKEYYSFVNPFVLNPTSLNITAKGIKSMQLISRPHLEITTNTHSDIIIVMGILKNATSKKQTIFGDNPRSSVCLLKKLGEIFHQLAKVLQNENDTVMLESPCYVHGDLVGNLQEVTQIQQTLMPNFPNIHSKHVFLGNYFSKTQSGLECFIYLACLKIILPDKIILLLGCNEINLLKIREFCLQKYGPETGYLISELLKKVIPHLPLSAVVDGTVYCCNSGQCMDKKVLFNDKEFTLTAMGQQVFGQPPDDNVIGQFLKTNGLSYMLHSNTDTLLTKTLSNRCIRIGSCSSSSSCQLHAVQIVDEFIRIIAIRKNKIYSKNVLMNLESKTN